MVTTAELIAEVSGAPEVDNTAIEAIENRIADILRPSGSMARFEDTAQWMAGWQRTASPSVDQPVALIFAADHGVVGEGVSAYPSEVTAAMLAAFNAQKASVSALAAVAGATVQAIDVGVGNPTNNLRVEAALSHERFADAFEAGRAAVRSIQTDLLIVGEMGIGNTTAAAAVCAALIGPDVGSFIGRGTGIDDEALEAKTGVVADAVKRIAGMTDPLEILREVGGAELVAIAGAIVEARVRSIPVLLDGYICTSPALTLHQVSSNLIANCRAAHRSPEPGHQLVLDHLGLDPLLTLDMRLGEASGAMAAVPLVAMACKLVTDVPTFTEWFAAT